jgi:SAM-dependent methyltransferase
MSGQEDVPSPIDFHDPAQARDWEESTLRSRPWRPQAFALYAEELKRHSASSVLELGSGPGHLAKHILSHCNLARYAALDFSAAMHQLARERLGSLSEKVEFLERDFRQAGWPDGLGLFDAVVTHQAAHETRHKRHLPGLLERAKRCLRKGGLLLYGDHFAEPDSGKHPDLYWGAEEQPMIVANAGFTDIRTLLVVGGVALFAATNS